MQYHCEFDLRLKRCEKKALRFSFGLTSKFSLSSRLITGVKCLFQNYRPYTYINK